MPDKDKEHRPAFVKGEGGVLECANCGSPEDGSEAWKAIKEVREQQRSINDRLGKIEPEVASAKEAVELVKSLKTEVAQGFEKIHQRFPPDETELDATEQGEEEEIDLTDDE